MTSQHGEYRRPKLGWILAIIIGVFLVGVIVNVAMRPPVVGGEEQGVNPAPTLTTPPSPSASPEDEEVTGDPEQGIIHEDYGPPDTSDLSDVPRPTDDQVWLFETAFNTLDPETKKRLLEEVATSQYVAAHRDDFSPASDVVVVVNESKSTLTTKVDYNGVSCYVETNVVMEISEDGVTRTVTLVPHGSYWVNTPDGWRVAMDAEVK